MRHKAWAVLLFTCLATVIPCFAPTGFCADIQNSPFMPRGYGGGGRFTAVGLTPGNPDRILIGSDVAGVFKSTNGGQFFALSGEGLEGFAVADILSHPARPDEIFLLMDDGLYFSDNGGISWAKKSSTIRYNSRCFGSRLMVLHNDSLFVATDRNGVFRVTPRDPEWSVDPLPGLEQSNVYCLGFHDGLLYAGTSRGIFRYGSKGWKSASSGLPSSARVVLDIAGEGATLYAVEEKTGPYALKADGTRWEWRGATLPRTGSCGAISYKAVTVQPGNPETLLLATHPESWPHMLFKSTDGGRSWNRVNQFALAGDSAENWAKSLESVEEIAFSTTNPCEVYLTDWWNVWKSLDGGEHWEQLHHGLQNTVINDIKMHPNDPATIFVSAADNGLMVSTDGGSHWRRRMAGVADGHAREVEISRSDPSTIYLLMNPWGKRDRCYVYKSIDGGDSWKDIGFPLPAQTLPNLGYVDGLPTNLEIDHSNSDTIYVATNGYGIFKSTNGGASWTSVNTGITSLYVKGPGALLMQPGSPDTLFVGTLGGGIFKTVNGGAAWSPVSGENDFVFGMAMDPSNPKRMIACCAQKKVIISEDEGQSWNEVPLPGDSPPHIASYAVAISPSRPEEVLVGTFAYDFKAADGLFASSDGGRSFEKYPLDLPRININCITMSGMLGTSGDRAFLGFNGIGVFMRGGM